LRGGSAGEGATAWADRGRHRLVGLLVILMESINQSNLGIDCSDVKT